MHKCLVKLFVSLLLRYDDLIKCFPEDFRGYLAKGVYLWDKGQRSDAERMFLQVRAVSFHCYFLVGTIQEEVGRGVGAERPIINHMVWVAFIIVHSSPTLIIGVTFEGMHTQKICN